MKVAAIIQARMCSTRLPGKVLRKILGKPMLWHLIQRLKQARLVDQIIVATSINPKDQAIEEFCVNNKLKFFRGPESDVLGRFYEAAKKFHVQAFLRITGDCPLIDPEVADKVVSAYLKRQGEVDGSSNVIKRTFPRGLDNEVFSLSALEKAYFFSKESRYREHVTLFMYEKKDEFKILSVENPVDLSGFRWTVDEENDFLFVKKIYQHLYDPKRIFLIQDVLNLLKEVPLLKKVNHDVTQKAITRF